MAQDGQEKGRVTIFELVHAFFLYGYIDYYSNIFDHTTHNDHVHCHAQRIVNKAQTSC